MRRETDAAGCGVRLVLRVMPCGVELVVQCCWWGVLPGCFSSGRRTGPPVKIRICWDGRVWLDRRACN